MPDIDLPVTLTVSPDGTLEGGDGTYAKHLADMAGVYRDEVAYAAAVSRHGEDALVYRVESQGYGPHSGALTIGTSTLLPGRYGDEFAVTRGHLHAISDRAELYYCLAGNGVMLLETIDGRSEAIELAPGQVVNVPGEWVHRSVNVGNEPFVTLFTYATDAGQNYQLIADANGMRQLVVSDGSGGWALRENPDHTGYRTA